MVEEDSHEEVNQCTRTQGYSPRRSSFDLDSIEILEYIKNIGFSVHNNKVDLFDFKSLLFIDVFRYIVCERTVRSPQVIYLQVTLLLGFDVTCMGHQN